MVGLGLKGYDMYRQSMLVRDAQVIVEVIRLLEGYKVKSTIVTGSSTMSLQSPDTFSREETATVLAMKWVRYQGVY